MCLKTLIISTIGWWAILTLNSEKVFCLNSGTNWPSSIILYSNCRIEFTFETACFPKFLPKWGFAKNDENVLKAKKGYIIAYLAKKLHPMSLNITFKWRWIRNPVIRAWIMLYVFRKTIFGMIFLHKLCNNININDVLKIK